ncbi:MAG: peroxiredoxin [Paracoccaceae bacterium]|nr:peroxiredoxin [Paracoccaceae bacterium]
MTPQTVPEATFRTRARSETGNTFVWKEVTTKDVFARKRIVLFALPGAFTPACTENHLPGYEKLYDDLIAEGIDEVICLAVNDAFVMFHWARHLDVKKVFMLADGNAEFTRKMGMLVDRSAQGMGMRSWRYAMLVEDRVITRFHAEPGFADNPSGVPVAVSDANTMLRAIRNP